MTTETCIQGEPAECGLACLVMLASKAGITITLEEIRTKYRPNNYGISIEELKVLASEIGVDVNIVLFDDISDLNQANGVGILHLANSHYVLLDKVNGFYSSIRNPAMGKQLIKNELLKPTLSGYALVLNESNDKPLKTSEISSKKRKKLLDIKQVDSSLVLMGIVSVLLSSIIPAYVLGSPNAMLENGKMEIKYFIFLFILQASALCISYIAVRKEIAIQNHNFLNQGTMLFRKMFNNTIDFFERRHASDVTNKFLTYINSKTVESTIYNKVLIALFKLVVGISILLYVSTELTLVIAFGIFLRTVMSVFIRNKSQQYQNINMELSEKANKFVLESYQCAIDIKTLNKNKNFEKNFEELIREQAAFNRFEASKMFLYGSVSEIITLLELIVVFYMALVLLSTETIAINMVFVFLLVRQFVNGAIEDVLGLYISFGILDSARQRASDFLQFAVDKKKPFSMDFKDKLVINELVVKYQQGSDYHRINLPRSSFKNYSSTAVIGKSGSGKSSLLKALSGFYLNECSGLITIDGKLVHFDQLHEICHLHSSEQSFFTDSIFNNITLKNHTIRENQVIEILELLGLRQLIEQQPNGIYSRVDDNMHPFSSGEKQRLLLARALLSHKPILLLDEPFSNLDSSTSRYILNKIKSLDKTIICTLHDQSIVSDFDNVIELSLE